MKFGKFLAIMFGAAVLVGALVFANFLVLPIKIVHHFAVLGLGFWILFCPAISGIYISKRKLLQKSTVRARFSSFAVTISTYIFAYLIPNYFSIPVYKIRAQINTLVWDGEAIMGIIIFFIAAMIVATILHIIMCIVVAKNNRRKSS